MTRALIFDCDGTLVDNADLQFESWSVGLAAAGAALQKDWYHARVGIPGAELLREFQTTFHRTLDTVAVTAAASSHYIEHLQSVRVIERVAQLARGATVPIAVASGGRRAIVEATLHATNLSPLFDTIVTIEDVACGKPAPDLFLEAARRLGVSPSQCHVYEDSDEGIIAARAAGMQVTDVRVEHD
jgi:HAD superfamily hydrolase (TIGR01509 family)